jgi:catechol 2,3-dioxygenase-like lactoylglutathione lyase family enzyme
MIEGLSHITLLCRDLNRMEAILTGVLDAEKVYDSGAECFSVARERFFLIGGVWVAIMEGTPRPGDSYEHIAFKISEADFDAFAARIVALGLKMRPPRLRVAGEGQSLYFHDDDGQLFEFHTGTLAERLARYAKGKAA